MSAAGRLSLNPFAFRASAEPSVAAHRYAPCSVSIPLLSGPVLNYSDILDIAGNPEVSIPLLSGPVLNTAPFQYHQQKLKSQSLCFQGQC